MKGIIWESLQKGQQEAHDVLHEVLVEHGQADDLVGVPLSHQVAWVRAAFRENPVQGLLRLARGSLPVKFDPSCLVVVDGALL